MLNFEGRDPINSHGLDRRSFLRATGAIAAATLTGGLSLVKEWARRKLATPAQIALAWLSAQQPWIVPIPGATKMPHLLDNLGAGAVRFTPEEVPDLNTALARTPIHGARLPAGVLALSGVEAPAKQR